MKNGLCVRGEEGGDCGLCNEPPRVLRKRYGDRVRVGDSGVYGIVFTLNPPDSGGNRVQVERGKVVVYWSRGGPEKKEERKSEELCGITGKRCDLNKLCGSCKQATERVKKEVRQLTRDKNVGVKVNSVDGGRRAEAKLTFSQIMKIRGRITGVYVEGGKCFTD